MTHCRRRWKVGGGDKNVDSWLWQHEETSFWKKLNFKKQQKSWSSCHDECQNTPFLIKCSFIKTEKNKPSVCCSSLFRATALKRRITCRILPLLISCRMSAANWARKIRLIARSVRLWVCGNYKMCASPVASDNQGHAQALGWAGKDFATTAVIISAPYLA